MAATPDRVDIDVHPHMHELTIEPARPARIVMFNRWAGAIALVLGIIVMTLILIGAVITAHAFTRIADTLNTPDPPPAVTGCPFGDDQCGG